MTNLNETLKNLAVTADELEKLQGNNEIFMALSEREQTIIEAMRKVGGVFLVEDVGAVNYAPIDRLCSDGVCYRLLASLPLPAPEPEKRNQDDWNPFPWTVDGEEIWCCPVRVISHKIMFMDPRLLPWMINAAMSIEGFLGCMTADDKGWPSLWCGHDGIRRDVSALIHQYGDRIKFVCFRKG